MEASLKGYRRDPKGPEHPSLNPVGSESERRVIVQESAQFLMSVLGEFVIKSNIGALRQRLVLEEDALRKEVQTYLEGTYDKLMSFIRKNRVMERLYRDASIRRGEGRMGVVEKKAIAVGTGSSADAMAQQLMFPFMKENAGREALMGRRMQRAILRSYNTGGELAIQQMKFGIGFGVRDPWVLRAIAMRADRSVIGFTKTEFDQVKRTMTKGFYLRGAHPTQNTSDPITRRKIPSVTNDLMDLRPGLSRKNAARIAQTEAQIAQSTAKWHILKRSQVENKAWESVKDSRVRKEHQANQLQGTIPIDRAFSNGQLHPGRGAAHQVIRCRCTLTGIVEEVQEEPIAPTDVWHGEEPAPISDLMSKPAAAMKAKFGKDFAGVAKQEIWAKQELWDTLETMDAANTELVTGNAVLKKIMLGRNKAMSKRGIVGQFAYSHHPEFPGRLYVNMDHPVFSGSEARKALAHTVAHEIGHSVQHHVRESWGAIRAVEPRVISAYARTNWKEDFCESVGAYFATPDELAKVCPKRYSFLREYVFKNRQFKGVPIAAE